MSAKYHIGFRHDMFKEDGTLIFKDVGFGMINANLFQLMKPTTFLINTSRGRVINEVDLVGVLRQGKLGEKK